MSSVPEAQDRPLSSTTVTVILTQAQNPALVLYLEQVFVSLSVCFFIDRVSVAQADQTPFVPSAPHPLLGSGRYQPPLTPSFSL